MSSWRNPSKYWSSHFILFLLLSDLFSPREYLIKPKPKESKVEKVIEPVVETAEEKEGANEKAKETAEEKPKVTK